MNKLMQKVTTICTTACFVMTTLLAPAGHAMAATCDVSDYSTAAGQNPACTTIQVGQTKIAYPKLTYETKNSVTFNPSTGFSATMLSGQAVQVNLNQAAAMLGIPSSQVPAFVNSLPSSSSLVFGRYAPQSAELRIDVIKVQKTGNTVSVLTAPFTPQMGNMWAAQRTYMTAAEKAATSGPGPNPFARYAKTDNVFHGVSFADSTAILGTAMRYSQAPMTVLSVAQSRLSQRTEESGNFLRKTVTYIIEGWTKPTWYIGLPIQMQPEGVAGVVCAVNESKCAPEHMVMPFANFQQWDGGNLPHSESKVYDWRTSHSSWSVIAIAIFVVILSFIGAGAVALATSTEAGAAGMASGLLGAGFPSLGIGGAGLIGSGWGALAASSAVEGLAYIGEQMLFNGASSPFEAQRGYNGAVGWQTQDAAAPSGEQATALYNIERTTQIVSDPGQSASVNSSTLGGMSGNVSQFDAGYNMVKPEIGSSYNFNSMQYVRDTQ